MHTLRAVTYARVSTDRQKEQQTIASQLAILPDVIKRRGFAHVRDYVDDGVSGETIEERPAMSQLLEDAWRGEFDVVVVIDIDRLTRSRQSFDWELIKEACRRNRITVVTPSQEYDFRNEDHELISDFFSRIAAYEKKKILGRTLRGKHEKAKQGRYFGGKRPYGYSVINKIFAVQEAEAEAIREMYRLAREGYGLERITAVMRSSGYPTPTGRPAAAWAKSTITKILSNPMYAGRFTRWRYQREQQRGVRSSKGKLGMRPETEWLTVDIPAIVSPDMFETVRAAMRGRKAGAKRNAKRDYLLGGLIACGVCGGRLIGECSPRERKYYVCWNRRRKIKPCDLAGIRCEEIEDAVWKHVAELLTNARLLRQAIDRVTRRQSSGESEIRRLEKQLERKHAEGERLIDLYQSDQIQKAQFESRMGPLKEELGALQAKLTEVRGERRETPSLAHLEKALRLAPAQLSDLPAGRRKSILRLLFQAPRVHNGDVPRAGVFVYPDGLVDLRGVVDFDRVGAGCGGGVVTTTS